MFSLEREKGQHFKVIPLQIHSNTSIILVHLQEESTNNMVDK